MNPDNQNMVIGGTPLVISPLVIAVPGAPVAFTDQVTPLNLPTMYTTAGQPMFPPGQPADNLAPNTIFDIVRFTKDLAAQTGQPFRPYRMGGMAPNFSNGYIETFTAGLEHEFGDLKFHASYVGTAGVGLAEMNNFNGYNGATAEFAPFTVFDATGRAVGGAGPVMLMASRSHSTFHSLQVGLGEDVFPRGSGFPGELHPVKIARRRQQPLPRQDSFVKFGRRDHRHPGAAPGSSQPWRRKRPFHLRHPAGLFHQPHPDPAFRPHELLAPAWAGK